MALGAFTLPFTDVDLTGQRTIIFEVSGGGNLTATVDLPTADAGLTYGYYNYKDGGDGVLDSLADAVCAAMTAVDSQTWSPSEDTVKMPGTLLLSRGGTLTSIEIKWNHASTTFPAEWLGFDSSSSSTGAFSAVSGTWPAGRMWLPPRSIWTVGQPRRSSQVSRAYGGKTEKRTLSQGFSTYKFKASLLSPPRCLLGFAADADWYVSVPLMVQSDPNTPFEALWRWMDRRAPLRYHADRDVHGTYLELDVSDAEALSQLVGRWMDDPHELGSNPLQTVSFEAIEYVT